MTRIIGIDPGAAGAIALFVDGALSRIVDTPTTHTAKGRPRVDAASLAAAIKAMLPLDHAIIEQVAARPHQGVASMFAFGMALGVVLGVTGALAVPMTSVTPAEWKTSLRVPRDKHGARARASQLLPQSASLWPRAKDDGRAEAALIGLWYVLKNQGAIEW
jgi:crossover junction endodeoxyribonuclease RuvC